ncbi:uncharacterized protein ACOB7L_028422 isoform 3-T5 [Callospermophilus lateralis]|uniref:uncharacterized protein LOC143381360 isoform X3 n=1 Tax=Callospermophilus lateralis TaxID=76772 RepID=UPI004038E7B7
MSHWPKEESVLIIYDTLSDDLIIDRACQFGHSGNRYRWTQHNAGAEDRTRFPPMLGVDRHKTMPLFLCGAEDRTRVLLVLVHNKMEPKNSNSSCLQALEHRRT